MTDRDGLVTRAMAALCRVGWHRWSVTRVESIRYGALVTERCLRCPAVRTQARWP